jgi:predicted AlkP superfamily pyrophosphatase or phosphodiesterase
MPRLLLIIIDGCRPDALHIARTPNITSLWQAGAYTWTAQTVMPSVTLPAHTSMFRSISPQKHGIESDNVYKPSAGAFPSFVDVARRNKLHTAMFYTWEELRDLSAPGSLTTSYYRLHRPGEDTCQVVAAAAAQYVIAEQPDLCILYMDDTDLRGHESGWMSPPYLEAVERADRCVGLVMEALDKANLQYTILLQSDHGGHEFNHGTELPEDMNIPWILSGPGAKHNHAIQTPVNICDTAATIAHLLGLPRPDVWEGQPVYDALL